MRSCAAKRQTERHDWPGQNRGVRLPTRSLQKPDRRRILQRSGARWLVRIVGWNHAPGRRQPATQPTDGGDHGRSFVDDEAPRPVEGLSGTRIIAIYTDLGDADIWRTGDGDALSDEELRDEIGDRVRDFARDLADVSEPG